MVYPHVVSMSAVLFVCSAININVLKEYKQSIPLLANIIGVVGVFGLISGIISTIYLSITLQWWLCFAVFGASLIIIGIFSFLTRSKISLIIGSINILFIPFIWWYGSNFNSVLNYYWMYDIGNAVIGFFL